MPLIKCLTDLMNSVNQQQPQQQPIHHPQTQYNPPPPPPPPPSPCPSSSSSASALASYPPGPPTTVVRNVNIPNRYPDIFHVPNPIHHHHQTQPDFFPRRTETPTPQFHLQQNPENQREPLVKFAYSHETQRLTQEDGIFNEIPQDIFDLNLYHHHQPQRVTQKRPIANTDDAIAAATAAADIANNDEDDHAQFGASKMQKASLIFNVS